MKESLKVRLAAKARKSRNSRGHRVDSENTDENTTNSETSEGNNLFNGINWEENIDVDTSDLTDEFAPRPNSIKIKDEPKDVSEEGKTENNLEMPKIKEENDEIPEQEFVPGTSINVMDYKTSTWDEATIVEVDWEENEVFVRYNDTSRSNEWVAMSSQRLSREVPPETSIPLCSPIKPTTPTEDIKPIKEDIKLKRKRLIRSSSLRRMKSLNRKGKRGRIPGSKNKTEPEYNGKFGVNIIKRGRTPRPKETIKTVSDYKGKFEINEKVLAKWSDHRMQKFPAIIKSVAGEGSYNVLFYDGFEKTLSEENLFKTTEEECAKYRHSNPSEADSFVDMEVDSKEARRQRKKKTFEDYVFDKDIMNSKKKSLEKLKKDNEIKDKKKHKLNYSKDDIKSESESHSPQLTSPQNKLEVQGHLHEVETKRMENDRWHCPLPATALPISILTSQEGITFKSVLIPDRQLPRDWAKHALQVNLEWKIFLISPDKYKINTFEELKNYYTRVYKAKPKHIDFEFNEELMPQLTEQQKDMQATSEVYHNWIVKQKPRKGVKKLDISGSSSPKIGKVKTLLPKFRLKSYPTTALPEETEWNCPKDGCGKKFRKESLLQMHIKHYHVEFESLVGTAPKMVDLALARSEHAEAGPSKLIFPVKRRLDDMEDDELNPSTPIIRQDRIDTQKRPYQTLSDKKPTIKTMLPNRQPSNYDYYGVKYESNSFESDDEKLFKPKQHKKPKLSGMKDRERFYPVAPGVSYIKKKAPMLDINVTTDSNDSFTEDDRLSPGLMMSKDGVILEKLKSEEVINCTCGFKEEDGLMIQCDICMCWQHGICYGVENDSEVPDQYVCYICRHPPKVRSSKKYSYATHYLSQGKLPSFSFRTKNESDIKQREFVLKRVYEISQGLNEIKNVDQSLRAKLNIAEQVDHPKLYLWAKSWSENVNNAEIGEINEFKKEEISSDSNEDKISLGSEPDIKTNIPIPPEEQIDPSECRLKLLEHIDVYLQQMDDRLTSLQTQIAALESEDVDLSSNSTSDKTTKQAVQMVLHDLKTVQKLAAIS